ncbi:MAG: SusD/RagB family nutrient-binding outer membrane lipoprotein [Haliscomenobacteraceae bacterium CHB4]|nr:hypothetical protein [Saprospiraceae bacterium]MCE7925976.1 SusD/RagB family nutrient-binding outer membrane lipoprotein [Haliscomenobacteraceae bacterium CHB4]
MKKTISILTLLALAFFYSGCEKYVEGYDISPNDPLDVNVEVLLTGTQVATFSNYTGNLARLPAVLMNQLAGRQFQFEDFQEYIIRESAVDNEFQQLYNGGMVNAQLLIDKAGDDNPIYRGIGRVLKVMNIGLATDLWGDVPYSKALKGLEGEENFNPAYDTQENILRDMQAELDLAVQDLSSDPAANIKVPGADDLIFGGDPGLWRNIARVLKARYYNHLSKRDAPGSANQALAALDAAYADGFDNMYPDDPDRVDFDDMMAYFGEAANEWNQWYAFEQQRAGYLTMNQFFLDLLTDDPRLPLYATANATGGFDDQQPIGPYYSGNSSSLPLVTYFEAKFIEAEAAFRAGDKIRAATAFNTAVVTNVTKLGVADPDFIAANANETEATITLEKIMTQKYIAMFTQPEVWADWRRTNLPALTPNPNASVAAIPRRLTTAQSERLYNSSATVVTDILQPVWWDQ